MNETYIDFGYRGFTSLSPFQREQIRLLLLDKSSFYYDCEVFHERSSNFLDALTQLREESLKVKKEKPIKELSYKEQFLIDLKNVTNKKYKINRAIGSEPTLLLEILPTDKVLNKMEKLFNTLSNKKLVSGNIEAVKRNFLDKFCPTNANFRHLFIYNINYDRFKYITACKSDYEDVEFETVVLKNFKKKDYLNLCKEFIDLNKTTQALTKLYDEEKCDGGNHIQIDMPFESVEYNKLLLWNLNADIVNYPEIAWFFNHPADNENGSLLYEKAFNSDEIDYNNGFFFKDIRLNDEKDIAICSKYSYKTLEFRFFAQYVDLKEAEFQYDFLMKFLKSNIKATLKGEIKKLVFKKPSQYGKLRFKKSKTRIAEFMNRIGIELDEIKHQSFFRKLDLKMNFYKNF